MAEVIIDLQLECSVVGKEFARQEQGTRVCSRRTIHLPWKGRGHPFDFTRTTVLSVATKKNGRTMNIICGVVKAFTWEVILGRDFVTKAGFSLLRYGHSFSTMSYLFGAPKVPMKLKPRHSKVPIFRNQS